jgi:hypothetical protein
VANHESLFRRAKRRIDRAHAESNLLHLVSEARELRQDRAGEQRQLVRPRARRRTHEQLAALKLDRLRSRRDVLAHDLDPLPGCQRRAEAGEHGIVRTLEQALDRLG